MAEEAQPAEQQAPVTAEEQQLNFLGMDQAVGIFADAFLLARKEDSYTIYFFQQTMSPDLTGVLRQTSTMEAAQAKCIGKIILSPQGAVKLAEGLAANLAASQQEPEKK